LELTISLAAPDVYTVIIGRSWPHVVHMSIGKVSSFSCTGLSTV